jgi:hypothetical protein
MSPELNVVCAFKYENKLKKHPKKSSFLNIDLVN